MKAFIAAGGMGTRLAAVTGGVIPKPMAKLRGKPVLQYAVENLRDNGADEIYISVGHLREKITEYFGNGEKFGVKVRYITEETPLGSGGALYYLKGKVSGDFAACSGDALFDVNLRRMLGFHKANRADITLACRPNDHPFDSDLILREADGRVTGFLLKNEPRADDYLNLVNAGFFIINSAALDYFTAPRKANMEHDFIASAVRDGKRVFAYRSTEYIKDMGTPERLAAGERDLGAGLPALMRAGNKRRAVFLDRDGVINRFKGYITKPEQIELCPDAAEAVGAINASDYLAVVVTNQPAVARGECTLDALGAIFRRMETLLGQKGAYVDATYFCPHHPDAGFPGEVPELKIKCDCRKPGIGMLKRARDDFNLDMPRCVMFGDDGRDIEAARRAGIPSVFIKSELNASPALEPDYRAKNFSDAVRWVLNRER